MIYTELASACKVFGIGERATLKQIKTRHRELVKAHHPDRVGESAASRIREISAAYTCLLAYCKSYRFNFNEEEFLEQEPEERLRRQFERDPVWGNGEGSNS